MDWVNWVKNGWTRWTGRKLAGLAGRRWNLMYNSRKLEILKFVRDVGTVTSSDVAGALGLRIHNARMLLYKYHRQGLLSRRTVSPFRAKEYSVTERGVRRLAWLKGQ